MFARRYSSAWWGFRGGGEPTQWGSGGVGGVGGVGGAGRVGGGTGGVAVWGMQCGGAGACVRSRNVTEGSAGVDAQGRISASDGGGGQQLSQARFAVGAQRGRLICAHDEGRTLEIGGFSDEVGALREIRRFKGCRRWPEGVN